jgi:hypothetical protein
MPQTHSRLVVSRFSERDNMKLFASSVIAPVLGAVCIVALTANGPALAQGAPFAGMEGNWTGTGTVTLGSGSTERLRCRASYRVGGGGQSLEQTLRCASDSYKFDLSSTVQSQGDRVTGNWQESNRNIAGNLQGRASGGTFNVLVEAAGFAANLSVTTRGNKQTVAITSQGEIRNVDIAMTKG